MTKREPFARVTPDGRRMYFRGNAEAIEFEMTIPFVVEKLARMFNAAHDKDVRKAVEEFRERAVKLMREHPCTASIYGDGAAARGAKSSADYLASLVESLPTEPEA